MTETNERMQYRASGTTGTDGTAAWPDTTARAPLMMSRERFTTDSMSEDDRRTMERFGITPQHKTVYTYKAHVYDRLADAVDYARIDSGRVVG